MWTLLFIHSKANSLHLPSPNSKSMPPPRSPLKKRKNEHFRWYSNCRYWFPSPTSGLDIFVVYFVTWWIILVKFISTSVSSPCYHSAEGKVLARYDRPWMRMDFEGLSFPDFCYLTAPVDTTSCCQPPLTDGWLYYWVYCCCCYFTGV